MIVLSLALLGFAAADLLRWSPDRVSPLRTILADVGATAQPHPHYDEDRGAEDCDLFDQLAGCGPSCQLAWILAALLTAFAASGHGDSISGPFVHWYSSLPFFFVRSVEADQFLLGASATLFLLATANRIVRLALSAAGTPTTMGETKLKGGRLLGPMERLFVGGMALSGNLTGAAVIIAAKGLLRLPEIRSDADKAHGVGDQITEYFLIGTFCSLLLAGGLAALVSVSA